MTMDIGYIFAISFMIFELELERNVAKVSSLSNYSIDCLQMSMNIWNCFMGVVSFFIIYFQQNKNLMSLLTTFSFILHFVSILILKLILSY
jgi:hypothetical protein